MLKIDIDAITENDIALIMKSRNTDLLEELILKCMRSKEYQNPAGLIQIKLMKEGLYAHMRSILGNNKLRVAESKYRLGDITLKEVEEIENMHSLYY